MELKKIIIIFVIVFTIIFAVITVKNNSSSSKSNDSSIFSNKIDNGTVINQDKGYDENNANIENIQVIYGEEGSYFVDEDGIQILEYNQ